MEPSNPHARSQDDLLTTIGTDIELTPGYLLAGRFAIVEALGQGGQAQVYKAHDQITDDILAIKILGRRSELSEHATACLRDELLAARQVSDPHVIRVHEFYRDQDYVFYTMDYIAGTTLAARIQQPITRVDVERWLAQLIGALQACHRAQIVHGDIKPANILINDENQLILADFGISAKEHGAYLLNTGSGVYRAPESLAGEPLTRAVDIYALGRLLERLLQAMSLKSIQDYVWRFRWQRLARKLVSNHPDSRPSLTKLESYKVHERSAHWVFPLSAVVAVALIVWWFLMLTVRDSSTELASERMEQRQPQRIAFIANKESGELSQLASIVALKLTTDPSVVVTPSDRVVQLLNQLQLNPFDQPRDRQRLAGFLNVDVLVFLDPIYHSQSEHDYLQVYLTRHPDNQVFGIAELSFNEGHIVAVDFLLQHLDENLRLPSRDPGDVPLISAAVAAVIMNIHESHSLEELLVIEREVANKFEGEPALWLAFAQQALNINQNAEVRRYLQALQSTSTATQFNYWLLLGHVIEAELENDYEAAAQALDSLLARYPSRPDLLEQRADIALLLDDVETAERHLEAAIAIDPNSGYRWFALGRLRINLGEMQSAIHHELAQGLIRFQQQEDLAGQGVVLNAIGVAHLRLGNLEMAKQHFEAAIAAREAIEDLAGQAVSLGNLANVLAILQDYEEADQRLHQAMEIFSKLRDFRGRAQVLNERGYLAEEQGQYVQALQYFREALELRMRFGSTEEQAETISNVAFAYFLSGDYSQADVFLRQALTLYERIGLHSGVLRTELQLAHLHLLRGEYQTAARLLAQASEVIDEKRPIEKAFLYFLLSHRNFGLGNMAAAFEHSEVALETALSTYDIRAVIENYLWQLEMCFWLADIDCFKRRQSELGVYQDAFTTEQTTILTWLTSVVDYLQGNRQDDTQVKALKEAYRTVNLPIQSELKIALSLWELAPHLLDEEEKQSLLTQIRSAYYKDYLQVHYLATRDGHELLNGLDIMLLQHPNHWRNHLYRIAHDDQVNATLSWPYYLVMPIEQQVRYLCWFLQECQSVE